MVDAKSIFIGLIKQTWLILTQAINHLNFLFNLFSPKVLKKIPDVGGRVVHY